MPFVEAVAAQSNPNSAALTGQHREFEDEVGVLRPAGRDDAVGVPHVFMGKAHHDLVEPLTASRAVADCGR